MEQTLTMGGYLLAWLFVVFVTAWWVQRHHPARRDAERQGETGDRDGTGQP